VRATAKYVRWTPDGFEMLCHLCLDWWPLTTVDGKAEFWDARWGLRRCRACIQATRRAWQADRYQNDPAYREMKRASSRLTAWKDRTNKPELVKARRAAYYWAHREEILAWQRAHYAKKRAA